MTGPEHYREAERLLRLGSVQADGALHPDLRKSDIVTSDTDVLLAAQVHATLAKAPAAPVDLSELRHLVRAFDPTCSADLARAFKHDLLQAIVSAERGEQS